MELNGRRSGACIGPPTPPAGPKSLPEQGPIKRPEWLPASWTRVWGGAQAGAGGRRGGQRVPLGRRSDKQNFSQLYLPKFTSFPPPGALYLATSAASTATDFLGARGVQMKPPNGPIKDTLRKQRSAQMSPSRAELDRKRPPGSPLSSRLGPLDNQFATISWLTTCAKLG